ncbi:MAG: hypothetical protein EB123_08935, partial [Synechococcaceae bacterium WBB_32_011]|nr:hypothetical protein [Synechococcaceae bacterium WBB_32_011]
MTQARLEVLDQLDQLEEIVLEGARVPFSGGRLVNEQDAIEILDAVRQSIPREVDQAVELMRQKEAYLGQARQQAEEIINQARREREALINAASVRQEAERQGAEVREQARQQGEQLLIQARRQVAATE